MTKSNYRGRAGNPTGTEGLIGLAQSCVTHRQQASGKRLHHKVTQQRYSWTGAQGSVCVQIMQFRQQQYPQLGLKNNNFTMSGKLALS